MHAEVSPHLHRTIQAIRAAGARPSVALNPSTPLDCLEYVLGDVDMVLLMTVNPGFGGQSYIPAVTEKVRRLRRMADERGQELEIQVDGGVKASTVGVVAQAGANVLVAGTAVFGAKDYRAAVHGHPRRGGARAGLATPASPRGKARRISGWAPSRSRARPSSVLPGSTLNQVEAPLG